MGEGQGDPEALVASDGGGAQDWGLGLGSLTVCWRLPQVLSTIPGVNHLSIQEEGVHLLEAAVEAVRVRGRKGRGPQGSGS